jgi:hypothetical protein
MVKHKGYEVKIHIPGQGFLEEYFDDTEDTDVTVEDKTTVTRYVEAVTGSRFEIRCRSVDKEFPGKDVAAITARAFIDGDSVGRGQLQRSWPHNDLFKGWTKSEANSMTVRSFVFGEVTTSELQCTSTMTVLTDMLAEDHPPAACEIKALMAKSDALGTIEVRVIRVSSFKDLPDYEYTDDMKSSTTETYHEKLFKGRAVSHRTTYACLSDSLVVSLFYNVC